MAIPPGVFDRRLLRSRRLRAGALGPETFLIDRVAADMADRLSAVVRDFEVAAVLGGLTGVVARSLAANPRIGAVISIGTAPDGHANGLSVVADEEALPFRDGSLALAVSALTLQFVNDLPGVLAQVRRALKPDGLFLAALVGGDSLIELRSAFAVAEAESEGGVSPRVAPFVDVRAAGALLQRAGLALPVADVDRIIVRYADPFALMRDLRRMGATNVLTERRRVPLKRTTLYRMADTYAERFSDADERIRATFDIVWLSGWAPHESQQKPLRPGSAAVRLSDALGVREVPSGDKPER